MGLDQSGLLLAALTDHQSCRVHARLCLAKSKLVDLGRQDHAELRRKVRLGAAQALG